MSGLPRATCVTGQIRSEKASLEMSNALLAIIIVAMGLAPSEYYFTIFPLIILIIFLMLKGRVPSGTIRFVAPMIFIIGFGAIFQSYNLSDDAFKDLWYVSKIILVSLTGLMVGIIGGLGKDWGKWTALAVILLASYNIAFYALGLQSDGARAISYVAIFIAPFVWHHFPAAGVARVAMRSVIISLVILMIYLSGSRSGLLVLAVSTLAALGAFQNKARATYTLLASVALLYVVLPLLPQYNFYNVTFLGKISNSLREILFESGDTMIAMYANWRGFEAYSAFATWQDSTFLQKLFGLGWGAKIELEREVSYQGAAIHSLPFAHNGFFTLLVKAGPMGVALFVFFLLQPTRMKLYVVRAEDVILMRVLSGGAFALLLTTATISGPLNKQSLDGLLLFWACAYGALLKRNCMALSQQRQLRSSALLDHRVGDRKGP